MSHEDPYRPTGGGDRDRGAYTPPTDDDLPFQRTSYDARRAGGGQGGTVDPGTLLAEAFPERVARAWGRPGEVLLASGRGAFLDPTELLAREPWLAVAEMGGGDARDRIRLAAPVDPATLQHRVTVEDRLVKEPSGRMVMRRIRRLGAIVVDEKITGTPDRAQISAALRAEVEAGGLSSLGWGERAGALRARLAFLRTLDEGWPDVTDAGLLAAREIWLWPLLDGAKSLAGIGDAVLEQGLKALVPWDRQRALDALAPARLTTPLGSAAIDYAAEGGPRVDIRVQELFGVTVHPTVGGGRVPLTLALLSPAHQSRQAARDLGRVGPGREGPGAAVGLVRILADGVAIVVLDAHQVSGIVAGRVEHLRKTDGAGAVVDHADDDRHPGRAGDMVESRLPCRGQAAGAFGGQAEHHPVVGPEHVADGPDHILTGRPVDRDTAQPFEQSGERSGAQAGLAQPFGFDAKIAGRRQQDGAVPVGSVGRNDGHGLVQHRPLAADGPAGQFQPGAAEPADDGRARAVAGRRRGDSTGHTPGLNLVISHVPP